MLYIPPDFLSSAITYGTCSKKVAPTAHSEGVPVQMQNENVERMAYNLSLPLRYSGLPVRRRLIRMMLTLQKYAEVESCLYCREWNAFTPAADYARSVIDTAMLRGELRCRPSGEMAHDYMTQTEELLSFMAGVQQNKALLRREIRRRTAGFLSRYAAGAVI